MFTYPSRTGIHDHASRGFAVVDLETTGFSATDHRIVEIAVVRTDAAGKELGVFETLVDPGTAEVGPTDVHGITAGMLTGAPSFSEIAPAVLAWLEGVVLVAHNAEFEEQFLVAELHRAGMHPSGIPALDTLAISQAHLHLPNHKLATLCAWAGTQIDGAHTALGDARATATMLPELLRSTGYRPMWQDPMPRLAGQVRGRYRPRSAMSSH